MESRSNVWPHFEALSDLGQHELEDYLSDFIDDEGRGAIGFVRAHRRRSRLLSAPLMLARINQNQLNLSWNVDAPSGPVDVVMARGYIAAMPESQFKVQIVIGLEHEFSKQKRGVASHAQLIESREGEMVPACNVPFISSANLPRDATLNARMVFISGRIGERVAETLRSDTFRNGISLTRAFNPVFAATTEYLAALTTMLIDAGKSRVVAQGVFGTSDYGGVVGGSLGVGEYFLGQLPADVWERINELRFDQDCGLVMDGDQRLDANYMIIRVAAR